MNSYITAPRHNASTNHVLSSYVGRSSSTSAVVAGYVSYAAPTSSAAGSYVDTELGGGSRRATRYEFVS